MLLRKRSEKNKRKVEREAVGGKVERVRMWRYLSEWEVK